MKKVMLLIFGLAILFSGTSCSVSRQVQDDSFTYVIKNGQAIITEYIGRARQAKVPAEFRGYPVTEIADSAFANKLYVKEVQFEGQNLRRIGNRAFVECSITEIVFPESLLVLGDEVFSESGRLLSVVFSGRPERVGTKAFYGCAELETVALSHGAEEIGPSAFLRCPMLTEINLRDVNRIGAFAFGSCYGLTGEIETAAVAIDENAFIACKNISSVKAENVRSIGAGAFADCASLTDVVLSEQITSIPDSCFEGCGALKRLRCSPLSRVGAYAFHQCAQLSSIPLTDTTEIYTSSVKNSGITADCIDDDDVQRLIDGEVYTRTFYDDFDGDELNLQNWSRCPEWKRRNAYWRDEDSYVDGNGNLVLNVTSGPSPETGRPAFFSGAVRTYDTFKQKYGYFEIRCKLTDFYGFWSAFWLMPYSGMSPDDSDGTGNDGAELDIYESPFAANEQVNYAVHWDGYGQNHKSIGDVVGKDGLYLGYHTFALKWTEDEYVFYIDGQEYWRVTDPKLISHVEEYLIVSVEVGIWAGELLETDVPIVGLLTDYVKVYSHQKGE